MKLGSRLGAIAVLALVSRAGAEELVEVRTLPKGGAVVENRRLTVTAQPGAAGLVMVTRTKDGPTRVELALLPAAKLTTAKARRVGDAEAVLAFSSGAAAAELTLGAEQVFVKVVPGRGATALAIRADASYALLPDFFADDVIYDPRKFTAPMLAIPAENFLVQLTGAGRAMVMAVWPGELHEKQKTGRNPRVDLLLSGEKNRRRVAAARIEFLRGKPVFVGVLEHKNLWHDENVTALTGYKPTPIKWVRPFGAQWRADFIVADGKKSEDWHTRSQSFPFKGPVGENGRKWWSRGDENTPTIGQEWLGHIIYPCWFKGGETRLCLYADRGPRGKVRGVNQKERRKAWAAKKEGKTYKAAWTYPPNIYERVLIYPLDRSQQTPPDVHTPVDVMRQTLGRGPCEYILDLEGVKPRPVGGKRRLIGGATCGIWDNHIFPIVSRDIRRLKEGQKLDDKKKTHLVHALEDIIQFVHAVHDRIREYKKWGGETAAFLNAEAKRDAKLKPLAAALLDYVNALNKDVGRLRFEGKGTEGWWDERVKTLIAEVRADTYKNVARVGGIRNLGNRQDQMVARCRRYVKGLRQEASLADVSDPAVRAFAAEIRHRCQAILRNRRGKEGL